MWGVLYRIVAEPPCLPFLILARPKVKNNYVLVILTVFSARLEPAWNRWAWIHNRHGRRFGEDHYEISFGISEFHSKHVHEAVHEYGVGANAKLVNWMNWKDLH
jgi:hypothetical protein